MLFLSPSSLPISASVVAVKPLRAKHFAAADRIDATRGFSQSALRAAAPFSSVVLSLRAVATGSVVVVIMVRSLTGQPVSESGQLPEIRRPCPGAAFFAQHVLRVKPEGPGGQTFPRFFPGVSLASAPDFCGSRLFQKGIPASSVQPDFPKRPGSRSSHITPSPSPPSSPLSSLVSGPCVTTRSSSAKYSG